jgi:uncharacterized protein (DUF1800 family)
MRVSGRVVGLGRVGGLGMKSLGWPGSGLQGAMRAAAVLSLCVLMVDQPMLGSNLARRGPSGGVQPVKGEDRVLHALDRLTFGPRPGEVAAVQAMGLSEWFEMQLNPGKIDDAGLQARLAQFPAMQLPQDELMARYPSQQMVRQMVKKDLVLPGDPVERAIYGDEIAFYQMQKAKQAAGKEAAAANGAVTDAAHPGETAMDGVPAAPIVRMAPANDSAAGSDMVAAGASGAMSGGDMNAAGGEQTDVSGRVAALVKGDVGDPDAGQDQHVEQLFKDLEAVKIINLVPEERMRRVLAMAPDDFVAFRQSLSKAEVAQFAQGLSGQQRETFAAMQNSTRMVGAEEMETRLLRDIYSDRQMEAVMTDFWLNHFNVYVRKNADEPYLIPAYERAIRANALGKFEDLLLATAKSPAMLVYLDNAQSIGADSQAAGQGARMARVARNPQVKAALKDRGLNENYGRELMELHTLGVNGGYTQADVTQVAKVFTGWTITRPDQGAEFQFDERKHEPGEKVVLGKTIQEDGMNEGLQVLHMLATSPATAKFISTKLAVRFVNDDPPAALVDKMAQTFLISGGDIKAVLRTMFEAPEFWAPAAQRTKVKTPLEFVVSAVRASGANVNNALPLVQALDKLGMPLYGMQTPNGYAWTSDAWVNTGALVSRMNFALVMTGDKLPGVKTDWTKLLDGVATGRQVASAKMDADVDPVTAEKERRLEQILLGQPLSEKTRAAVLEQSDDETAAAQAAKEFQLGGGGVGKKGGGLGEMEALAGSPRDVGPNDREAAVMGGMMLGSPEFQRR